MAVIIDATTGISGVNGSAATPALKGSDSNTGISFGTDTVTINTGGVARVTTDSSGNVGIGATINNVFDQIASARPLLIQSASSSTTIAGSANAITISNSDTTTGNSSQLNFAAITGANANQFSTAVISSIHGARTNAQYPSGTLVFSVAGGSNTAPTERMRIDSSGNLLVGMNGSSNTRFRVRGAGTANSAYTYYGDNSAGTITFYVRDDGYFVTGSAAFSPYNYTTGLGANVYIDAAGGLLRSTSSLKYKTEVQDATHGLVDVLKLRPVTYKGKNDGNKIFGGLIAEEVHDAGLTEFVQYAKDGTPDALSYGNMVSLAFKAIQELNAKVTALETELASIKGAA